MKPVLRDVETLSEDILAGKNLLLAGDERLLRQLPKGSWIAGTIPYFIGDAGGVCTRDQIHVTEVPDFVTSAEIRVYDDQTLSNVYMDGPSQGFSFIVIPAFSRTHEQFSLNAPNFKGFASRPLIGWIAGIHLGELGQSSPKVVDGATGEVLESGAVVMHVALPPSKVPEIKILNIFEQGLGDTIAVLEDGFSVGDVLINGQRQNLANYLIERKCDTKLPLVADYYGAMVNASIQSIDEAAGIVHFYAPLFQGIEYKQAAPVGDYVAAFTERLPRGSERIGFSCNCILNYLYSELEGKKTGHITGPMTFGEIAYQLLNQTMVYLLFHDV